MSNSPVENESTWVQFKKSVLKLIGIESRQTAPAIVAPPLAAESGKASEGGHKKKKFPIVNELPDEIIQFGKFFAIKLPAEMETLTDYPSDANRDSIAESFAINVQKSLAALGITQYEFIEFYLPASAEGIVKKLYDTDTRMRKFRRICETTLFGAGPFVGDPSAARANKVYIVQAKLMFSPHFEAILRRRVLVRPLMSESVLVPLPGSPAEVDWKVDQLLVGLLQILNVEGKVVEQAPIWAWRAVKDLNSIVVNVDFDLMTRAFRSERHYFPLGLNIRCNLMLMPNDDRMISGVTMEMQETRRWLELLERVGKDDSVTYEIRPGGKEPPQNLRDYPDNDYHLKIDEVPESFPLGKDEQGRYEATISRHIGYTVRGDKTFTYYFGFFETALNYVPARNIMRVTGQLVLRDAPTDVMLSPGPGYRQEPVFRLTPEPNSGNKFKLQVLRTTLTVRLKNSNQELAPNSEAIIQIGDEVVAASGVKAGGKMESFTFTLRDLNRVPAEVANRYPDRPYSAFIVIEPAEDRKFVLFEQERVFGRGNGFHENAYDIGYAALKFTRPYVYLKMSAAPGQRVFYLNKASDTGALDGSHVRPLGEEEVLLQLNGSYEIYLGDFQIALSLKASPPTARRFI